MAPDAPRDGRISPTDDLAAVDATAVEAMDVNCRTIEQCACCTLPVAAAVAFDVDSAWAMIRGYRHFVDMMCDIKPANKPAMSKSLLSIFGYDGSSRTRCIESKEMPFWRCF